MQRGSLLKAEIVTRRLMLLVVALTVTGCHKMEMAVASVLDPPRHRGFNARAGANQTTAQSINTIWSDGGVSTSERVIKAAAGKLHQIFGRNTGGSDKYIFIFNHATSGGSRPANASTAHLFVPVKVKAGAEFSIDLPRPRAFPTGLYWGISSTDASFTYDAGGTFEVSAEYE